MRKLLILEVNEVPFEIFDNYIEAFPKSNLAKIFHSSAQYITISTDQGELHPWSTWPTFYRGVDNTVHHIKDLGEDLEKRDYDYPPVWSSLSKEGISLGIFSSLHTYPLPKTLENYDFLVPDPFANGDDTYPKRLKPFQAFNLAMSRKSGRTVDTGIDKGKAALLAISLPGLGLRIKTLFAVINQLIQEKISPWKAIRRRSYQSILAFDLYLKLLKSHKPQFTTFFTNHVASAMHRYWAATFPNHYEKNELPQEWIDRYCEEIPWCMHQLDYMLTDILLFIRKNPEYKLVIASSMGQAATKAELIKKELFLTDFSKFKKAMDIDELFALPAMHPQYNFKSSNDKSDLVASKLETMKINGQAISYRRKEDEFFSIDLGYPNVDTITVQLGNDVYQPKDLGFEVKDIDDQSGGTAYHIPEGSLIIFDPTKQYSTDRKKVDLREVAPSILKNYRKDPPSYMVKPGLQEIYD